MIVFLPQISCYFSASRSWKIAAIWARAAYLMDRLMFRIGLNGKSFIPLLSSFACAIPGIMATRVIENRRDRLVTMLVAPLMSCSARIADLQSFDRDVHSRAGLAAGLWLRGLVWFVRTRGQLHGNRGGDDIETDDSARGHTAVRDGITDYKYPEWRVVLLRMGQRDGNSCGERDVDPGGQHPGLAAAYFRIVKVTFPANGGCVETDSDCPGRPTELTDGDRAALSRNSQALDRRFRRVSAAQLVGNVGRGLEPLVKPLVGTGGSAARWWLRSRRGSRRGHPGSDYNLGAETSDEDEQLHAALRNATWEKQPDAVFGIPVALSLIGSLHYVRSVDRPWWSCVVKRTVGAGRYYVHIHDDTGLSGRLADIPVSPPGGLVMRGKPQDNGDPMQTALELNQGLLVMVMITGAAFYLVVRWTGIWSGKRAAGCGGSCRGCAQSNKGVTSAFVPADQLHISRERDHTSSGDRLMRRRDEGRESRGQDVSQFAVLSGLITRSRSRSDRDAHGTARPAPRSEISDDQLADKLSNLERSHRIRRTSSVSAAPSSTWDRTSSPISSRPAGMGQVFKRCNKMMGRECAVKVLPRNLATEDRIQNFTKEIRTQAQLDHPHLCAPTTPHDGKVHFLVTEYVPGTDLRRLVRSRGPLPMQLAASIISQRRPTRLRPQSRPDPSRRETGQYPGDARRIAKVSDLGLSYSRPTAMPTRDEQNCRDPD